MVSRFSSLGESLMAIYGAVDTSIMPQRSKSIADDTYDHLRLSVPWAELSDESRQRCESLGITGEVWENNRRESEDSLGLIPTDWIGISSKDVPWAKTKVLLAVGSRADKMRCVGSVGKSRH